MAQDYKISKVSSSEPRKYESEYGTVYYIKVMLEGHKKPVSIGKKSPDALKEGDVVYGDIQVKPDYDEDGFKAVKKPDGGGYSRGGKSQDEQNAIIKMNALTNSVNYHKDVLSSEEMSVKLILETATEFYNWVKGSSETVPKEKKTSDKEEL
jgi:hypothetical protein